ncbi:GreA/GreB family elongation factor [Marinoscillum pacificum]|uniref:GreA/GreB family elongation factor n=1 Tax=Marinoscillum pacificum TaxID=392723 RepID=UPI0021576B30|nr:GreA/GreB family elongation factor [Marinoscillum pacificum]
MSRAFVNEDNQEEAPLIPPRAPLPKGVTNYVTPAGLKALQDEREELNGIIEHLIKSEDSKEKRYKLQLEKGKLNLLEERLSSARLLQFDKEMEEVRFGAKVTVRFDNENQTQTFQIVGVDEADVKQNKIAFTAPVAKVLNGKKTNEQAILELGPRKRPMTILAIA